MGAIIYFLLKWLRQLLGLGKSRAANTVLEQAWEDQERISPRRAIEKYMDAYNASSEWPCAYCGSRTAGYAYCRSCGKERPDAEQNWEHMMRFNLEVAETAGDKEAVQQGQRLLEERGNLNRALATFKQQLANNAETPSASRTRCNHCGHDNRPQAKFCEHCGREIAG